MLAEQLDHPSRSPHEKAWREAVGREVQRGVVEIFPDPLDDEGLPRSLRNALLRFAEEQQLDSLLLRRWHGDVDVLQRDR